jgi:glycosyltransferase involved in cell wall biosynthesis
MLDLKNRIAFIVPTKDRPRELLNLLESFEKQTCLPSQIIIVDGGIQHVDGVVQEFPRLNIGYLRCIPPSAAKQRNFGIQALNPEIELVGFIDDDVVLEADALEAILNFWKTAPKDVGGVALNMVNHPQLYGSWFKSLPIIERLGLYNRDRGAVLSSGFQTMIGYVCKTTFVQWLPTIAVIWHRKILEEFRFDEWFEGYSYLEDLDFSYRVGKIYRLAVEAEARYYHYPSSRGRENGYKFGKKEVINRIHFAKKHKELSLLKCYLALMMRIFISLSLAIREKRTHYLQRVWGNVGGLIKSIFV